MYVSVHPVKIYRFCHETRCDESDNALHEFLLETIRETRGNEPVPVDFVAAG